MKRLLCIILLTSLFPFFVEGQTPRKIHDLKSLTDSSGTVHLFYRIYTEYEDTEYFTDNIYHYNTETGEEELFLEHFYDTRYGLESMFYVNEYDFFENDPDKYIYIGGYDFEVGYIQRYDTLAFEGFLAFPEHLAVSGDDTSMVYVSFNSQRVKSFDGGISWPSPREIQDETIPDSLKLNFPLTSLSPYNDSLMFGVFSCFQRSTDAGKTTEVISDTLLPDNGIVRFDADSNHVYLLDAIRGSEQDCSVEICRFGFYRSPGKGVIDSWTRTKIFNHRMEFIANNHKKGVLYIWDEDFIYISKDYGESIDLFYEIDEEITGVVVEGEQVFITTISSLYELEGDELTLLREIPVSIEERVSEIPSNITLHQNYPNPFNPSTVIRFQLDRPQKISLKIYSITGQLVEVLINEQLYNQGIHAVSFPRGSGNDLASGVYVYVMENKEGKIFKKMILIK